MLHTKPPATLPPCPHVLQDDATLQRALSYKFSLPPDALERGTARQNNLTRLRRALQPALKGEPLHVVVIGGSVTAGTGAGTSLKNMSLGYVNQFFDFLNATFVPTGGRLNKLERVTGSTWVVTRRASAQDCGPSTWLSWPSTTCCLNACAVTACLPHLSLGQLNVLLTC